jgi:hypothetical protein
VAETLFGGDARHAFDSTFSGENKLNTFTDESSD